MAMGQVEKQKQFAFGLYDAVTVERIHLALDKAILQFREEGLPIPTKKDLAATGLDEFVIAFDAWVTKPLSLKDSRHIAKREALRKKLMENFDQFIHDLFKAVYKIAEEHYEEVAEVLYGP
jgi:hypothetical protein